MKKISITGILLCIVLFGCKKDDDDNTPNQNNIVSIESDPQFTGNINGIAVTLNLSNSTAYTSSDGEIATSPDTSSFIYSSSMESNSKSILIYLGTLYVPGGGYPEEAVFKSFIQKGTVPYSIDAQDGIEIAYYDENFKLWSTSLSSGDQTKSTFTFNELKEEFIFTDQYIKFKASFNCTLYDNSGNQMSLTNGICVQYFQNM